ncbi:hypothetical protein BDV18DRAFT_137882, partial [Aspergillus unguis]
MIRVCVATFQPELALLCIHGSVFIWFELWWYRIPRASASRPFGHESFALSLLLSVHRELGRDIHVSLLKCSTSRIAMQSVSRRHQELTENDAYEPYSWRQKGVDRVLLVVTDEMWWGVNTVNLTLPVFGSATLVLG